MRNPDNVRAARAAEDFAVLVYRYTTTFPSEERFGLAFHMRKTAISIGSAIFEGCGRITNKGFVASLGVAHMEATELMFQVRVSLRLGFGDRAMGGRVSREIADLRRMIYALIQTARKQPDFGRVDSPASVGERSPAAVRRRSPERVSARSP
jgi:four helix bundle protein